MKKILLILTIISSSLIFNSCRKEDNPKLPDLGQVPVPLLKLSEGSTTIIEDNAEKANYASSFTVNLYFADDIKPSKYDIVVAMNGDYNNTKVYQSDLTEIPGTIQITMQKLGDLFGKSMDQLVSGTYFEVRASFTLPNGTTIPAFSTVGEAYSSDIQNLPGSNLTLKYQIVCPLELSSFTGTFTVLDAQGFWEEDYPVTLTLEKENQIRVSGFIGDPSATFLIDVDPVNRTVNVPSQIYGPGDFLGWGYNNFAISGKGEIDACNTEIRFNGAYSVDEGSFGTYPVRIVKNP